jgi:hypothetical protein
MRRKVGRAFKKHLSLAMQQRLSCFKELEPLYGSPLFGNDLAVDLSVYWYFIVSPKYDEFLVEGAWSRHGRFPSMISHLLPRPFPELGMSRSEPINGDFRFRLRNLWTAKDAFWQLTRRPGLDELEAEIWDGIDRREPVDVAIARIPDVVAEVIDRILVFGIPYFENVARTKRDVE